jgi:hypothetical protein
MVVVALMLPLLGATISTFAPASLNAFTGSVSSACSKPSVARTANFLPFKC